MFVAELLGAFSMLWRLGWADLKEIDGKDQKRGRGRRTYTVRFC